ncbi:MAG: DUF1295 domain-containing protein [Myxococcales bacterium]|nr:DUF1295 domain-containing protein [Myxococcales bacterium]
MSRPATESVVRETTRPIDQPTGDASPELTRLGRYGWVSGVAGAVTVLGMGYVASRRNALEQGWGLLRDDGEPNRHVATAFALLVCMLVMFAVELGVRLRVDRGRVFSVAEDVRAGRLGRFLVQCLKVYALELGLLCGVLSLYKVVNEYGYAAKNAYYEPWFAIIPYVQWTYAVLGFPYVVLTRALQHDPQADRKQAAFVLMKVLGRAARWAGVRRGEPEAFDAYDRSAVLGLFVKAFFVPLMTVFFADQFSHLVGNWGYLVDTVVKKGSPMGVRDVWNVSHTVIFSVDVGLAWAGYVLSSRWIRNTLFSVEPTLLGWSVALVCYPPFQTVMGYYFSTPSESAFLELDSPLVVKLLLTFSVASFAVYTASTACFGLRFSNLTHRGIITTGPYAVVRHPAYAAKNFSWWCVMFPVALHQVATGHGGAFFEIAGLVAMTGIYAMRAATEERHLGRDPEYRAYAARVRYRFIPGVF